MDLNIVISAINFIVIILFAFVVLVKDFRNKVNISFLLVGFITAFWIATNLLADLSLNISSALFWSRIAIFGPAFLPIVFFYLVKNLFNGKSSKAILTLFVVPILLISAFAFTNQNIKNVYLSSLGTGYTPGILYYFVFIYFSIGFCYTFWRLIMVYKSQQEPIRSQARLILIGSSLTAFLGIISNIILPILGFSIASIIGPPAVLFFIVFVALAILQYHLFDFKVIAAVLFTVSLCMALLFKTLYDYPAGIFFNGAIFIFGVFFGILLIRSIIKEVRQREQIAKMAEDVRRAYEIEKRAKEELEKLDKIKNNFLAQTQHDLRTPLGIIRDYCDLLIGGALGKIPKKAVEKISRIQVVAQNKIKDVNNFLDTAQFQLGKKVVNPVPGVQLNPIMDEIIADLGPGAKTKGIELTLDMPKEVITMAADREKLKAALFNIIDNSIKYTLKGGVTVTVIPNSQFPIPNQIPNPNDQNLKPVISITVKDTGIGIPAEKIATLFDTAFERSAAAKSASPTGRGIGLYLSSQIIKAHEGKVWVESAGEGKGSTFHIELKV